MTKSDQLDAWRWWRQILGMNVSEIIYGDSARPIARQLSSAICQRDSSLDTEKTYELCKALHEVCY
jgi:hypothetical protein